MLRYFAQPMTPIDSLEYHKLIAEKGHIKAKVLPAFRPDRLINIEKTDFTDYIKALGNVCGMNIKNYDELINCSQ